MHAKTLINSILPLVFLLTGCAGAGDRGQVVHLWREIKGIGVPYEQKRAGEARLLGDLRSGGCRWLPAGTTIYLDKPWFQSPYSPVYSYRLPGHNRRWPCTAEMVDGGLVYFSHAVVPSRQVECASVVGRGTTDHKAVVRPE
jgi:hypothetical protein